MPRTTIAPERGHRDPQDPPDHGVDELDEGPCRGLERRDDLTRRPVGMPGVAEPDQVLVPVRDGAAKGTQGRAPVEPATDPSERRRGSQHEGVGHDQRDEVVPVATVGAHDGDAAQERGEDERCRDGVGQRAQHDGGATACEREAVGLHLAQAVGQRLLVGCVWEEGALTHGSLQVSWSSCSWSSCSWSSCSWSSCSWSSCSWSSCRWSSSRASTGRCRWGLAARRRRTSQKPQRRHGRSAATSRSRGAEGSGDSPTHEGLRTDRWASRPCGVGAISPLRSVGSASVTRRAEGGPDDPGPPTHHCNGEGGRQDHIGTRAHGPTRHLSCHLVTSFPSRGATRTR